MSTYYVMGRSPLALPLGELSPQVTERVLPFALSVLAALGHLSQRERQGTGDADSHASDIGHWLGMTGQKQGAGAVDDPQVLLFAPSHIARKGECEGGTFDGFPHSRSITRPQATTFA